MIVKTKTRTVKGYRKRWIKHQITFVPPKYPEWIPMQIEPTLMNYVEHQQNLRLSLLTELGISREYLGK